MPSFFKVLLLQYTWLTSCQKRASFDVVADICLFGTYPVGRIDPFGQIIWSKSIIATSRSW